MKGLKEYVVESLKESFNNLEVNINEAKLTEKDLAKKYNKPLDDKTIVDAVKDCVKNLGWKADLNFLDTSLVTNMASLFTNDGRNKLEKFKGDISKWNVSNVSNMAYMFSGNRVFNCDISSWDVSNVTDMTCMFSKALKFKQDLSDWDVKNVTAFENFAHYAPIEKIPRMLPDFK